MSNNARQTVKDKFNTDKIVSQYENIYLNLVNRKE